MTKSTRTLLTELMSERILVLDGAMGTALQACNLSAQDFGGEKYEGCNELLVTTRPDVVLDIHRAYLAAGADIIETNTFSATTIAMADYGMESLAYEINVESARLARACSHCVRRGAN